MFITAHPSRILQPDSKMYIFLAEGLSRNGSFSYPDTPNSPDVERMPGYPAFLTMVNGLFGNYLSVVLFQVILDCFSCVVVYLLGEKVWKGTGLISTLLAAVNIGLITYAHFILNDSLFLFVFLLSLLAIFRSLNDPSWKWYLLSGFGIGVSAYIRPVIVYFPFFFVPLFFPHLVLAQKQAILQSTGKAAAIGIMFVLSLSPWFVRNHMHYGRYQLTAQTGEHLLQYIVPFSWQYSKGIPFIEGMKKANADFSDLIDREGLDITKVDPFEKSDLKVKLGLEHLKKEPKSAIAKAWLFGMAKNLFAPSIIDFSYLLGIDRPHFFYSQGKTLIDRGWNFIRSMKGWFGWALIGSMVGIVLSRLLQLWGFFLLFRKKNWEALLCLLIIGYFLIVSGPVGYAKYRLPFEPILIVLMAIGIKDLHGRLLEVRGRRLEAKKRVTP